MITLTLLACLTTSDDTYDQGYGQGYGECLDDHYAELMLLDQLATYDLDDCLDDCTAHILELTNTEEDDARGRCENLAANDLLVVDVETPEEGLDAAMLCAAFGGVMTR